MSTTDAAAAASSATEWSGGELLFCGGTDWAQIGRSSSSKNKKDPKEEVQREELYPNLLEPHRIKAFIGIRIVFVAGGPAAVHCMAADTEGRLYTWGRNEKGQLGHGDLLQRNVPKVVAGLAGKFVVAGAGGKHHSVVVTRSGESFAFGSNQVGQCGIGSIKKSAVKGFEDIQSSPVSCLVSGATAVAAGAEFSIWIAGGRVMGAGNPQYGQLGDGSDHVFNAKDSSIQICYEPQPTPKSVKGPLAEKTAARIACGPNHCVAVDTEGTCYTWGFGGYGRLGHKVQQDEFTPRKVEEFKGRISVPADAIVAAAGTASFSTTAPTGQMYSWGKLKAAGDNQMYPQVMMDLSGWNVRSMACGPAHFVVAADASVITWGSGTNGELGYGPSGKKSSANPAKSNPIEGMHVHQVAAGVGFSMFLAKPDDKVLDKAPVFESAAPEAEAAPAAGEEGEAGAKGGKGGKAAGKRKAEPAAKPAAKSKKAK